MPLHLRLATFSFLVMESLVWFAVGTLLAAGAGGSGASYLTILFAVLGGYGLTRALQRLDVGAGPLVVAGAAVTVLALTLVLNVQYNPGSNPLSLAWLSGFAGEPDSFLETRWPQTWGVVITCAAWFRGVWVAQKDFTYGLTITSFSVGLLIFVLVLIFGGSTATGETVAAAALPFFLSGLLTLALVHLAGSEGAVGTTATGQWLPTVLGTVAALGLVSALLGLFPLSLFYRLLAPAGVLLLRVIDLVILLIALPISWIVTLILNRIVDKDAEWPQLNQVATDNAERLQEQGERSAVAAFFLVLVKFLFVLAIIALVAYVLYRVFRHLRRPPRRSDEVRETVEGEGALGDDLNALFRGLRARFARKPSAEEPQLPEGVRRVRRVYLGMLADAEARGAPREAAVTPAEFVPPLTGLYGREEPAHISEAFAAARYGLIQPSRAELERLDAAANALRGVPK